ncbi:MAG: MTH1187 family thiamine-binding protein [Tissierellia bacterium]|nr:MTH1187 family thiamine-binding protein [Tissierellia bacterium]
MAIAEITFVPIGTKNTSCSSYVAKALDVLEQENQVEYQLNPMGTVITAATPMALYEVIAKMQECLFEDGIQRLYTVIKMDDRRDKESSLDGKLQSVAEKRG